MECDDSSSLWISFTINLLSESYNSPKGLAGARLINVGTTKLDCRRERTRGATFGRRSRILDSCENPVAGFPAN